MNLRFFYPFWTSAICVLAIFPTLVLADSPSSTLQADACERWYAGAPVGRSRMPEIVAASAAGHAGVIYLTNKQVEERYQQLVAEKAKADREATKTEMEELFGFVEEADKPEPPAPPFPLLSEKETIQLAQEGLANGVGEKGLSHFLLHSEFRDDKNRKDRDIWKTHTQYQQDITYLQKINATAMPPEEKLNQALNYLHQTHYKNYCRGIANMIHFVTNGCGNCQAQTKLILSLLIDSGFRLPENYQLGMQLYSDHVAPVVLFKENDKTRVIDLVTNQGQTTPRAPIYKPEALYYAYLKNKNQEVPKSTMEKLLLVREGISETPNNDNENHEYPAMESATVFDGLPSGSRFMYGRIPAYANVSRHGTTTFDRNAARSVAYDIHEKWQPGSKPLKDFAYYLATTDGDRYNVNKRYGNVLGLKFSRSVDYDPGDKLIFRDQDTLDRFKKFKKDYRKRSDIADFANEELFRKYKNLIQDQKILTITKIVQKPHLAKTLSSEELEAVADNVETLKNLQYAYGSVNTGVPFAKKQEELQHNFLAGHKENLRNLAKSFEKATKIFKDNPLSFIRFTDSLLEEKRVSFIRIFTTIDSGSDWEPFAVPKAKVHNLSEALVKRLDDPKQVNVYLPKIHTDENDFVITLYGETDPTSGERYIARGTFQGTVASGESSKTPFYKQDKQSSKGKEVVGRTEWPNPKLAVSANTMTKLIGNVPGAHNLIYKSINYWLQAYLSAIEDPNISEAIKNKYTKDAMTKIWTYQIQISQNGDKLDTISTATAKEWKNTDAFELYIETEKKGTKKISKGTHGPFPSHIANAMAMLEERYSKFSPQDIKTRITVQPTGKSIYTYMEDSQKKLNNDASADHFK